MEIALIVALATAVVLLTFLLVKSRIETSRRVSDSRREAIKQSRAVLGGRFTEQMTPYLPEFSYDPTEARFIGSPIDLIVFRGLSQDRPTEIVFVEVKAGKTARLTKREARVRDLVEAKKVRFELIHRPVDDSPL